MTAQTVGDRHLALRIDRPAPDLGPPQIHVGRRRSASSSAVMPPSLKPIS
jgi:hypothetical protein